MQLVSERLRLRRWLESDLVPFAQMNADPQVMRFFPNALDLYQSDAMVERIEDHFSEWGYGLWAAELVDTGDFIGFIGLSHYDLGAVAPGGVEIGWRLAAAYWNQGLATEGARTVRAFAHNELDLHEIVSFTAEINLPSRRVMEKIGLTRDPADDFLHPRVSVDSVLLPHVLYRGQKTDPF